MMAGSSTGWLKEDLIKLEYSSLREELARNKQYIFERPLAIIGAIGIALVQAKDSNFLPILPLFLIAALWTNLDLTVNRLRSSSRIASYICVIMEPPEIDKWIGWENSLGNYRRWRNDCSNDDKLTEFYKVSADTDSLRFYPTVYKFHIFNVLIAFCTSAFIFYHYHDIDFIWRTVGFSLSAIITMYFLYYCLTEYNTNNSKGNIEIEKKIWEDVLHISSAKGNSNK